METTSFCISTIGIPIINGSFNIHRVLSHPSSSPKLQINTFLIAGHETTSGLLSFTLHYLLKHPDVLSRAQAEADAVLGTDIGQRPTIAQIGKLEYTRAILLEALRLWPTAQPLVYRRFKMKLLAANIPSLKAPL